MNAVVSASCHHESHAQGASARPDDRADPDGGATGPGQPRVRAGAARRASLRAARHRGLAHRVDAAPERRVVVDAPPDLTGPQEERHRERAIGGTRMGRGLENAPDEDAYLGIARARARHGHGAAVRREPDGSDRVLADLGGRGGRGPS